MADLGQAASRVLASFFNLGKWEGEPDAPKGSKGHGGRRSAWKVDGGGFVGQQRPSARFGVEHTSYSNNTLCLSIEVVQDELMMTIDTIDGRDVLGDDNDDSVPGKAV